MKKPNYIVDFCEDDLGNVELSVTVKLQPSGVTVYSKVLTHDAVVKMIERQLESEVLAAISALRNDLGGYLSK